MRSVAIEFGMWRCDRSGRSSVLFTPNPAPFPASSTRSSVSLMAPDRRLPSFARHRSLPTPEAFMTVL
jgi:hypothetical protein